MLKLGRTLAFILIALAIAMLFIALPRRIATPAFMLLTIYPLLTLIIFLCFIYAAPVANAIWTRAKVIILVIPFEARGSAFHKSHILEVVFLIAMAFLATRPYLHFDPDMRVKGHEVEWLTGFGQVAYQGLQDTGTIPLWNPYYRMGEPLIDNSFNYLLNPFSSVAQLIAGSTQGTKFSVFITAIVAVIGGWFLGLTLGFSRAGRLLLALLILGKGNMHANFGGGYYQLATQQAYFAWALAGIIALIRHGQRWSIALTAISMTLMFLAGNLWHLLPMTISIGVVTLLYSVRKGQVNWIILRRLTGSAALTVGLCAVILLSVISNFDLMEEHNDEVRAGWETINPHNTYRLPFTTDYSFAVDEMIYRTPARGFMVERPPVHFYYSYVVPWWYVILLVLPIPILWKGRQRNIENRKLWWAGIGMYFFFTWWGMGGTPLFLFLYEHVPFLAQWRFVPRALGMATFWIAIMVAMRFDTLIYALYSEWRKRQIDLSNRQPALFYTMLLFVYVGATCVAAVRVNQFWTSDALRHIEPQLGKCVEWLGQEYPDQEKTLWVHGYDRVTRMIENGIRLYNIEADFLLGTPPNTIGHELLDARDRSIEWRSLLQLRHFSWFLRDGYRPMEDSPAYFRIENCIYENPDFHVPYAFTFDIEEADIEFEEEFENPLLTDRYLQALAIESAPANPVYDTIGVLAKSSTVEQRLLVIQELAYPGWQVWIDDERYPIEIFAKWNAVKLPMDGTLHRVVFMYRPPLLYIGAFITLLTSAFCILYLLRVDRFFRRS